MDGASGVGNGAIVTSRWSSRNNGINRRNEVKSNFSTVCSSLCFSYVLKRESGTALFVSVGDGFSMACR